MVDIPASCYARFLNPPEGLETEVEVNLLLHAHFRLDLPVIEYSIDPDSVLLEVQAYIRDEVQGDLEWALNRQHTTGGVEITDVERVEICDVEQRG